MGQALDKDGRVIGEAFGDTKREVFDALTRDFKDAHEIRIKTIGQSSGQVGSGVGAQMPKYRCHKEVWALHIESVRLDTEEASKEGRETDGSAMLTPSEYPFAPFKVSADYVRKHNPQAGGYYVQYADGYQSFSPAKAFQDGYTRI